MPETILLPGDFQEHLHIENAEERLAEARELGRKLAQGGVPFLPISDHIAIFTNPPHLVAGPLKQLGYVNGGDTKCYPSPVDGCDYINVAAQLPEDAPARQRGWFGHVAVVHPVDQAAEDAMLALGYGNPFVHHLTFGIRPPEVPGGGDFAHAKRLVRYMVGVRAQVRDILGSEPGALVVALPPDVVADPRLKDEIPAWMEGLEADQWQVEAMEGGGFLIQFFCLQGGRIEVALRIGTQQTFNPKSVHRISEKEISVDQG